jgi:TolB-like protein/tetratricopeptide (TPR) repeat protein
VSSAGGLDAEAVRTQLERILASDAFSNAPILSQFLRYVVERWIGGGESPLKEYTIGVEVFHRGGTFDPCADTIVRVHARNLRARLANYYKNEGRDDPVRITMPKGHYRVEVNAHSATPAAASEPPAPRVGTERITICVLPFTNLGGDADQAYFSDGITEDIITELSRWRLLAVRSRSASFRYRSPAVDVEQVARDLDVRFIVEGSVRRMGGRLRITAQLINAATGCHLWADKFDSELAEIFAVQDQIVRRIVSTLVGRLQASDIERARRRPPASLAAYECVLEGNALPWDEPDGEKRAIRLFEKAIEIDPGYGLAHALLANMHFRTWYHDPGDADVDAALDETYALAKRAVELDNNESTCFSILAQVCLLRRAYEQALQYGRRALEINPTNQWNTADMGIVQLYAGDAETALTWFLRAREIDPYFDPPWYFRFLGVVLMTLHRYEEALAMLDHLPPHQYRVAALKAGCHARLGHVERASACAAACLANKPRFSVRHFMAAEPFKDPACAADLAESLQMAGLPA